MADQTAHAAPSTIQFSDAAYPVTEGAETFVVTLSSASGARIGTIGTATVTITD